MVSHNLTLFIICYIKTTIQVLRYMINSSHLKTFIITLSNWINSYQNISAFNINHIIESFKITTTTKKKTPGDVR